MSNTPSSQIHRDSNGIPHVEARDEAGLFFGQGAAHATDRGMQILLMRIIGQGRISECLDSSDVSLRMDQFFRRANWNAHTQSQVSELTEREARLLQNYCDGVNSVFSRRVPWEFKLCGYRPEPWQPGDTVMLLRMIGYLTLAASQAEIEWLLIELVQAGIAEEKLQELFPGILGGLDVELIKRVKLGSRIVPSDFWGTAMPRMMASNNWVVSGKRSASGKPILANDPHLEGNRLPAVWCEMILRCGERYLLGGTMPGVPGVLTGRNNDLAWGMTYAFADAQDSWIEQCRDGKYYRENGDRWIDFRRRREVIKRKEKPAEEAFYFENDHGVLDGDPQVEELYLTTRWAAAESGAGALRATLGLLQARNVDEGMKLLGGVETAWNCVLADRQGNIGYQMSGLIPKRREGISGFVPLPGWKVENDWQGFHRPEDLPRVINPAEGFFATANDDLNRFGKAPPINMPMGPYRADRIRELLAVRNNFGVEDMFAIHFDVYSRQAALFLEILKPLLPQSPTADILRSWDLKYTADSEGAWLFEEFYQELHHEVFGRGGCGERAVEQLQRETGAFVDFYRNFDRVLLAETSAWFGGRSRAEIFQQAASVALIRPPRRWGEVRRFTMANIFFNGRLPRWLGFDRGPVVATGGRATIHQAQFYRSGGRCTSFLPAYRIVSDLATDESCSNLAGGPSDRRFSKWYCSDLKNWLVGKYKRLAV